MGSTIYHRGSLRAIVAGLACVILAILAGCTQVPPPPKLPSGWTLYRDKQFAFQMPIPPGWHTATMRDGPSDRPACVYVVGILPPGDHTQLTDLALSNDPELMYVMVNITCPDWGTIMPGLKETAVTVDGKAAQQYDSQIPDTLIGRSVVAEFGGHRYIFHVQTPITKGPGDLGIFTELLKGFQYTGS
ncbi:MAG TPA: hypothetical protein VF116_05455 [Ktedonobacterales bacterium]